jgi:cytochrome c oxidase assembly protein subunit 15
MHADVVIFLLGLTLAFYVAQGTSAKTKKAIRTFTVIALTQGAIGYIQYFTGIPEILVAAHLLGATLVWIAAWRIRLSVITQNG